MIRPENESDVDAIRSLTAAAFLSAPHSGRNEHFIIDQLRGLGVLALSLVDERMGAIIGHIAASPVSISDGTSQWYGIGPVSVHPLHQKQRIGSQLIDAALSKLREMGANGCVVLGDPAFYSRFGFKAIDMLTLPGVPAEYFQILPLTARIPEGSVAYHPAFYTQGETVDEDSGGVGGPDT